MNQSSKFNSDGRNAAFVALTELLRRPAISGQDIVTLSRCIVQSYSASGLSIDDPEIENIIGIESETDTLNLQSTDDTDEFERIYDIYLDPFEESRRSIELKLDGLTK